MEKLTYNNIKFYKIKDFPNYYISKCGKIYSSKTNKILKQNYKSEKELYMKVGLSNVKRYTKSVHRLVGKSFIPNPENKPYINHIDGNPKNNNMDNLEWCTHQENMNHAYNILNVETGGRPFGSKDNKKRNNQGYIERFKRLKEKIRLRKLQEAN